MVSTGLYETAERFFDKVNQLPEAQKDLRLFPHWQYQMAARGEPEFIIEISEKKVKISPGILQGPHVTLEGDAEVWRQIFEDGLQITQAYEEDRIYFSGLAPWRPWVAWLIRLIRKGQHLEFWERDFFWEVG